MYFVIVFGHFIKLNPFRKVPAFGSIEAWELFESFGVARWIEREVNEN